MLGSLAMEAEEVPRLLVEAAHDADHEVTIDGVDNFESSWKKKAEVSLSLRALELVLIACTHRI